MSISEGSRAVKASLLKWLSKIAYILRSHFQLIASSGFLGISSVLPKVHMRYYELGNLLAIAMMLRADLPSLHERKRASISLISQSRPK